MAGEIAFDDTLVYLMNIILTLKDLSDSISSTGQTNPLPTYT